MLVTTHAIVGGLIATKIPQPFISLPLILVVHFLTDRIPHWDVGTRWRQRCRPRLQLFIYGWLDLVGAIGLSWLIFQRQMPFNPLLWLGVFISLLPDFLELPSLFFDFRPWPLNKIEKFHSRLLHRSKDFPAGLWPQLIILALILLLA